jgi:hypothetical protein
MTPAFRGFRLKRPMSCLAACRQCASGGRNNGLIPCAAVRPVFEHEVADIQPHKRAVGARRTSDALKLNHIHSRSIVDPHLISEVARLDTLSRPRGSSSVGRTYGSRDMVRRFALGTLADAVNKVKYAGLDLSNVLGSSPATEAPTAGAMRAGQERCEWGIPPLTQPIVRKSSGHLTE